MALHTYALVTVGDLKTFLGISTPQYDSLLEMLINQSTDFIESKCDRRFKETTHTNAEYNGNGTKKLVLKQYPVISFTQLQENHNANNSDNWSTIDAEDYWVEDSSGIITMTSPFSIGTQNYRVTYSGGYATIPSDLQFACCLLAGEAFNQRRGAGIKQESLGDHSITFESVSMSDGQVSKVLWKYRKLPMADVDDEREDSLE